MDSRMDKYHDEEKTYSRVSRNKELYQDLNKQELNSYEVKSNATVLGNHENEIDVEKIKKILDTKYQEPKRKTLNYNQEQTLETESIVPQDTTKEYDLNVFLEKAKSDKEESYEEIRHKKLRDTQFDILNNLNLTSKEETKEINKEEDEDLVNLINTITINEVKQKKEEVSTSSDDPLNILTDLKGSENTEVFEGLKETIDKIEQTSKVYNLAKEEEKKETKKLDNSFYTTTNIFKEKDFVENEDSDKEKVSIGLKILIAILILAFVGGLFLFLKTFIKF